jgi:hypothetical protein
MKTYGEIKSIVSGEWRMQKGTYPSVFDGVTIETSEHTICIGVDNQSQCCESWGFLQCEDDFKDYIGATVLQVVAVDTNMHLKKIEEDFNTDDECGTCFINVETSKGTLQFAAYNSHNGYYGHDVVIRIDSETIEDFCI